MPRSALLKRLDKIRSRVKEDKYRPAFPDLKVEGSHNLSNNLKTKGAYKQDKMKDHLWRRGLTEKPATIEAMESKAKRIRPHFSKGGYQYSTDGDNAGEIRIHRK